MVALALTLAPSAHAQSGSGTSTCNASWSYTWVNSSASIAHRHEAAGYWNEQTKPSGVSSYRGWRNPGPVFMTLDTAGTFNRSGAVYGCAAA